MSSNKWYSFKPFKSSGKGYNEFLSSRFCRENRPEDQGTLTYIRHTKKGCLRSVLNVEEGVKVFVPIIKPVSKIWFPQPSWHRISFGSLRALRMMFHSVLPCFSRSHQPLALWSLHRQSLTSLSIKYKQSRNCQEAVAVSS